MSAPAACCGVVLGLAMSWLVAYLVGGAGVAAPHWFYLPVLYAAARFGSLGAGVSAVAAALLAGPLMPLDVAAGVAQQPEDWITRGVFFVIIGQAMALVIGQSRSAMTAEFERLHMEKELRSGIHRREFVLHYQPIVSLSSGEIVGVEALVRWQHPLRLLGCDLAQGYYFSRPLPPDELLPLLQVAAPFASAVMTDRTRLALVS